MTNTSASASHLPDHVGSQIKLIPDLCFFGLEEEEENSWSWELWVWYLTASVQLHRRSKNLIDQNKHRR